MNQKVSVVKRGVDPEIGVGIGGGGGVGVGNGVGFGEKLCERIGSR